MNIIDDINRKGYTIIKNVLSNNECEEVRAKTNELIKDERFVAADKAFKEDVFIDSIFKYKIISAMKEIMKEEPVYLIPDIQIHKNIFLKGAWHTDSDTEVKYGYLNNKDYKFYKVGIYTQENNEKNDGSINVMSGSHKCINAKSFSLKRIFYKLKIKFINKFKILDDYLSTKVNINAGDAIIFDSRLAHAGSISNVFKKNSVNKDKITIYFNFSNEDYSQRYLLNSYYRLRYGKDKKGDKSYMFQTEASYPKSYSENVIKNCEENNIAIQSFRNL